MPTSGGAVRALSATAVAAALLTGAIGCADKGGKPAASAVGSVSASGSLSASGSVSGSVSASASASATAAASPSPSAVGSVSASPSRTPAPRPPSPTRLTVSVDTRGGRLALVRGGAAQEFTVTLRNGNSAEYRHVLVAFQMELLVGEPGDQPGSGPGFLLERFHAASGSWRPADLRIANDAKPLSLFTGGTSLARDAVRTERYRMRATAGGPTGSTPVVVSFIDTDTDRAVAAHVVLGHSTR
ncbi:hypothetical protein OG625_01875 [Streptomyces sp. NBC_01351]|uniref:hypothetical protein n=1 Tax=Streptomyces sp. NBC_01351 TaxID=2903833 RepID=UPI002E3608E0|nr:hypothetical protein [Streptomyces sp. NBC_01351]